MKKKYIAPEMEVFEQKMTQPLMTTSLPVSDIEITSDEMLAPPGMEVGPSIPGVPSFIFE